MDTAFLNLLNMSITASWIALAVILFRFLLKKAPKFLTVILWGLVGLRLCLPFSLESIFSLVPSAQTIPNDIFYADAPAIQSGIPVIDNAINPVLSDSFAPNIGGSINPIQVATYICAIVWAIGVFAMLAYALISFFRIKRQVREAALLNDNIWVCDRIDTPFILGVVMPRIYLPSAMQESDIKYVIAHEKAHLKRYDHLWKPLGFLLLSLHWFNPIIWIAYVLLCRDIEGACDEKVIKENGTEIKKPYSQALINCSVTRKNINACPLAFGETGVKSRVKGVLNYKKPTFWVVLVGVVALIITAVCFLTTPTDTTDIKKPNSSININEELSIEVLLESSITTVNRTSNTRNNFVAIDYQILHTEETANRVTVYLWVLYEEYSFSDTLNLETSSHLPTVITASKNSQQYELKEYWRPHTDLELYETDIKDKFPEHLWEEALNSQKYTLIQKGNCLKRAQDHFAQYANKLTWTYTPMHSYTGSSFYSCEFALDYTHIIASCDNGMMKNLKAENQPAGTPLRFEKGEPINWSPYEGSMEKIENTSKVHFAIYDGEDMVHSATLVFSCIEKTQVSAEFEIYAIETDGILMTKGDAGVIFLIEEDESVSHIGGLDSPEDVNITNENTELINRLKNTHPHFFNVPTEGGLTVYIWEMAEGVYECHLANTLKESISGPSYAYTVGAVDIREMRAILSTYDVAREDITLQPVICPHSDYAYEIDADYIENINRLFWVEYSTM